MVCYYCRKEETMFRWKLNPICKKCYSKKMKLKIKTGFDTKRPGWFVKQ